MGRAGTEGVGGEGFTADGYLGGVSGIGGAGQGMEKKKVRELEHGIT